MHAAVTGASGFLGSHLCRELDRRGFRVRALLRDPSQAARLPAAVEAHTGDLVRPESLHGLADGCELFFHLGAATAGDWPTHRAATVEGTRACLALAEAAGVARFLHVSSIVVFRTEGARSGDVLDDDAPLAVASPAVGAYARGKIEAEALVGRHAGGDGLLPTILRPGLIYGPDRLLFPHLGPRIGRTFLALGGDAVCLPLCSSRSVVEAIVRSATSPAAAGRAYTVVDQDDVSRRAYVKLLNELSGSRYSMISLPLWPLIAAGGTIAALRRLPGLGGLPDTSVAKLRSRALSLGFDATRLEADTGWKPPASLREELEAVLAEGESTSTRGSG